ncbi:AI-2E family transporter, partial [Promicromonospora sukumoe]
MPDPAPRPAPQPAGPQREPARRDLDRRDSARPDSAPPPWLRTSAGWSWRLILVVAGIALVFWAVTQ